jgi:hypothetical protein
MRKAASSGHCASIEGSRQILLFKRDAGVLMRSCRRCGVQNAVVDFTDF